LRNGRGPTWTKASCLIQKKGFGRNTAARNSILSSAGKPSLNRSRTWEGFQAVFLLIKSNWRQNCLRCGSLARKSRQRFSLWNVELGTVVAIPQSIAYPMSAYPNEAAKACPPYWPLSWGASRTGGQGRRHRCAMTVRADNGRPASLLPAKPAAAMPKGWFAALNEGPRR
jgi:hypothetical protein